MPRPLKKKPPQKQQTPFNEPTVCTDDMLHDWRHLSNIGKQINTSAHALEPLLNRLDAAEAYATAQEYYREESDRVRDTRKTWLASKGVTTP